MSTLKYALLFSLLPMASIAQNADSAKVYADKAKSLAAERRYMQATQAIEKALAFDSSKAVYFIESADYYDKMRNNFKKSRALESAYKSCLLYTSPSPRD